MRWALVVLVGVTGCGQAIPWPWKQSPPNSWVQKRVRMSEDLFSQKQYEKVAVYLEVARSRDLLPYRESIALYHNLGNCYLLCDMTPDGILAYRRGLQLDPNHHLLRENLALARSRVDYPPSGHGQPESDAWPVWLYQPSPFQALVVALLFWAIACGFLTAWVVSRRSAQLYRAATFFILALGVGFLWIHLEGRMSHDEDYPLVVINANHLPFLRGNGPTYPRHPDLPTLSRGMEGRKLLQRGDWLQIQFASGEIGWVPRSEVLVDEP